MKFARLQQNFEALALEDPLWAVLSDKSKKGGKWDTEAFYRTGEIDIDSLESRLSSIGIPLKGTTALDFGCGVGRLTFPLSQRFETVLGVDISTSMLAVARHNANRGSNCQFILNTKNSLDSLETKSLDLAYSEIVFQHIAPRDSKRYFIEIAAALKPDGLFIFQLPSHLKYGNLLRKRLSYLTKGLAQRLGLGDAYYEMNAIPRSKLVKFIEQQAGLPLVTFWDHPAAGPNWQSYLYVFRKT